MLPLPANSIAVPALPMIAPVSKMLTEEALTISMPIRARDHAGVEDAAGESTADNIDGGLC